MQQTSASRQAVRWLQARLLSGHIPLRRHIRRTTELTRTDITQSTRTHTGILVMPRTIQRIIIRMATWQITRQRFRKFRPTRAVITPQPP